jgi:hypothetical protein
MDVLGLPAGLLNYQYDNCGDDAEGAADHR